MNHMAIDRYATIHALDEQDTATTVVMVMWMRLVGRANMNIGRTNLPGSCTFGRALQEA